MTIWRTLVLGWSMAALAMSGCAKFPDQGTGQFTKRLAFRMDVDRRIRSGLNDGETGLPYVYIVALRLSTNENPTDDGPFPVVTPGGNGFVAGNCTHYVLWNPLGSPAYQIWQFRDRTLNESFQTGVPVSYRDVERGDRSLEFEIDLSQLVPLTQVDTIRSVQVNFLTMNNTNQSGGGRVWDALGDARIPLEVNSPILVRLRNSQVYSNATQGGLEPAGDTPDPDLDITDWQVEVRLR